jgi:hypothetical protein
VDDMARIAVDVVLDADHLQAFITGCGVHRSISSVSASIGAGSVSRARLTRGLQAETDQRAQGEAECDCEQGIAQGQGDIVHGVLQCAPERGGCSFGG